MDAKYCSTCIKKLPIASFQALFKEELKTYNTCNNCRAKSAARRVKRKPLGEIDPNIPAPKRVRRQPPVPTPLQPEIHPPTAPERPVSRPETPVPAVIPVPTAAQPEAPSGILPTDQWQLVARIRFRKCSFNWFIPSGAIQIIWPVLIRVRLNELIKYMLRS